MKRAFKYIGMLCFASLIALGIFVSDFSSEKTDKKQVHAEEHNTITIREMSYAEWRQHRIESGYPVTVTESEYNN